MDLQHAELLAKNIEQTRANAKRIEKAELRLDKMDELVLSVREIAIATKNLTERFAGVEKDVEAIKEAPVKKMNMIATVVITAVITAVVSGIVGYILAKFGIA